MASLARTIFKSTKQCFMVNSLKRMTTWGPDVIKPPIKVFGIEGRYATALYSAATKQKVLDKTEQELLYVLSQFKADPKFHDFVLDPTIKKSAKAEAFAKISSVWGLSPITTNLLVTIAEYGRLKKLESIIRTFEIVMAAHRKEIKCEITSASPLSDAQKQKLQAVLKAFTKPDELIKLKTIVDPRILGGIIVSIGDRYVDMSVSSKVHKYCDILSSAV